MSKIFFIPFRIVGGLLGGAAGKRIFKGLWARFDREEPPSPKDRDARWLKVALALALQGAVFSATRGIVDRAFRSAFSKLTGSWPGEKRPQPK